MSMQLNVKLGLVVLLFSATLANADGGLIFLEKNIQSQQEMKTKTTKQHHSHLSCECK
ncbi:hypothetical protein HI850_006550 [bacterium SPL81]|nr:hypothetical protein [Acinetobacter baumannii]